MFVLAGIRTALESCSGLVTLDGSRAFSWTLNLTGNTLVEITNIQVGAAYLFKIVQPPGGGCSCTFLGPSFDVYARSLMSVSTAPNAVSYVIGVGSDQGTVTIGPNAPADPPLAAPLALSAAYDAGVPDVTVTFDQDVVAPSGPGYPLGTLLVGTGSLITATTSDGSPDIVYTLDAPFASGETPDIVYSAGNQIANIEGTPLAVPVTVPIPVGPPPIDPETVAGACLILYSDDVVPDPGPPSGSGYSYAATWNDRVDPLYQLVRGPSFAGRGDVVVIPGDPLLNGHQSLRTRFANGPNSRGRMEGLDNPNMPAGFGTAWTLYFVGYVIDDSDPFNNAGGWGIGANRQRVAAGIVNPGTLQAVANSSDSFLNDAKSRGALGPVLNQAFIFSCVFPGPSYLTSSAYCNGVPAAGQAAIGGTVNVNVGARNVEVGSAPGDPGNQPTFFWPGSVGFMAVYSTVHDDTTRQGIEAFLANYYGIAYP